MQQIVVKDLIQIQMRMIRKEKFTETVNMQEEETLTFLLILFIFIMKQKITAMLDSINNGAQGLSNGDHHGGNEATPNPAERKRGRSGLQPFGLSRDVTMESGPTPIPVPLLPGGKDLPVPEGLIFQAIVADGGGQRP